MGMIPKTIKVEHEVWEQFRTNCESDGKTTADVLREFIADYKQTAKIREVEGKSAELSAIKQDLREILEKADEYELKRFLQSTEYSKQDTVKVFNRLLSVYTMANVWAEEQGLTVHSMVRFIQEHASSLIERFKDSKI